MKKDNLLFRVICGISASLILAAAVISTLSIYTTQNFFTSSTNETLDKTYQGLEDLLEIYKKNAKSQAELLAQNDKIIRATKNRDRKSLLSVTTPLMQAGELDYLVVTDPTGKVLIRTHEPNKIPADSDSIANQGNVKEAINGKSFVGIEEGKTVKLSVRAGTPLFDESGALIGVLSTGYIISQNLIVDQGKNMFNSEVTFFLQDERAATTILDPNGKRILGTKLDNQEIIQSVLKEGKIYHGSNQIGGQPYATVYGPLIGADGSPIGIIFAGKPLADIEAVTNQMIYRTIISSLIVLALILAVTIFFTRRMLKPVQILLVNFKEIAAGNLSIKPLSIQSKDEFGQLATAFNTMLASLRELVGRVAHSSEQLAASSEELTASAEQTAKATELVAASITDVASGTAKQAASVDHASGIVQTMSNAIGNIAGNSKEMADSAHSAASAAESGGKLVTNAIEQIINIEKTVTSSAQIVADLGKRSEQIGQIVDAIQGLAGQTNLLALNAAIEAARAGEQGRGFAVVAEEVRKLAEQSEASAKQIAALIGEIQKDTQKAVVSMDDGTREVKAGTEAVQNAGKSFSEIAALVEKVSGQVSKITTAIHEMANGSEEIVAAMLNIDEISKKTAAHTETVSAATEEQSASMEEIASSSHALSTMAEELQATLRAFKM